MSYSVIFSKHARKQLEDLEPDIQRRLVSALERIRIRPEKYVQKLAGRPNYRIRVGDYRVILDIEHEKLVILVIKVGHRKNVYKD